MPEKIKINNKKVSIVFCLLLVLFALPPCYCQTDSLLSLLKIDKEDTLKVNHLNQLSTEYRLIGDYKNGSQYGNEALALSKKLDFKKGIANAHTNIGLIYNYLGNYPEALKSYFAALQIREGLGDKAGISISYNNIGVIYDNQGNFTDALKNYFIALRIRTEMGDKKGVAYSYNNIGVSYLEQAEVLRRHNGNADSIQNKLNEALKNIFASLKIKQEFSDKRGIASSFNNIGLIFMEQAELNTSRKGNADTIKAILNRALNNYRASLKLREETEDKEGIATSYINLGEVFARLKKPNESLVYFKKALALGQEIGSKDDLKTAYAGLTHLDSLQGDFKAAFEHHKLYIVYRDSLDNEETKKKTIESALTYEFEKKELAAKAQQEKLDAITLEEKEKQNIIIYAVAGVLLLVIIFSIFLFKRFRITQKQKKIIEEQKVMVDLAYDSLHEKNKEVMDSIRYAKRIQNALITSERYIARALEKIKK